MRGEVDAKEGAAWSASTEGERSLKAAHQGKAWEKQAKGPEGPGFVKVANQDLEGTWMSG